MANDLRAALAALRAAYVDRVAKLPPEPAKRLSAPAEVPEWLARDLAEERAAIIEHDGGMIREDAEAAARAVHGLPKPATKAPARPNDPDGGRGFSP